MNVLGGAVSISYFACSLHHEVCILAVYARYVAPPTNSMSSRARAMAAKTLEWEMQQSFRCKSSTRQAFLKIVSTDNPWKKFLGMFLYAAALYHLHACLVSWTGPQLSTVLDVESPDPLSVCWWQSTSSAAESWGPVHETTACLCQHLYGKATRGILLRFA